MALKDYWTFEQTFAGEGWTVIENGGSTIIRTVEANWLPKGTKGARVTVSGTSTAYIRQDVWGTAPAAGETRSVGFWYRRQAASANTSSHEQLHLFMNAGVTRIARWMVYDNVTWGGAVSVYNDAGGVVNDFYRAADRPALGRWAYVQIAVTRASTAVASDGAVSLRIDGIEIASVANVDNYDRFVACGQMRIGSVSSSRDGYSADFNEIKTGETLEDVAAYSEIIIPQTIILKSPEHVSHQIITRTKTRHTAGGQLHQVRANSWPMTDVLEFTFNGLTRTMVDDLITTFTATAGNYVTVFDEQNREWYGIVISNEIPFEQITRGVCPLWSCVFTFEGVLQ